MWHAPTFHEKRENSSIESSLLCVFFLLLLFFCFFISLPSVFFPRVLALLLISDASSPFLALLSRYVLCVIRKFLLVISLALFQASTACSHTKRFTSNSAFGNSLNPADCEEKKAKKNIQLSNFHSTFTLSAALWQLLGSSSNGNFSYIVVVVIAVNAMVESWKWKKLCVPLTKRSRIAHSTSIFIRRVAHTMTLNTTEDKMGIINDSMSFQQPGSRSPLFVKKKWII